MEKWVCTVCGYVYNSEIGHPKSGIEKGTEWENLPENWTCPLCAVNKDQFEKIEK